jgi:RNA polymerase sigma-70 factor, ECF subfamily
MTSTLPKKRFLDINTAILVKGCQQNDILCQQQLYKLYYPDMIRICYRYAKDADEAGIIYNNAMLRVFKSIGSYTEAGKLAGWIKTIVINSCIDFSKKQNIFNDHVSAIDEDMVVISPAIFDSLSGKDIQLLIAELPGATATVFNMYVYEGFTHRQIGEQLGISDGTSKWHLSEAKKILKQKLEHISKNELKTNAAG